MVQLKVQYSLRALNTFGIDTHAERFFEAHSIDDVRNLVLQYAGQIRILGGGSNILLTQPVEGVLMKNAISGIEVVRESARNAWVRVGGGVLWHDLTQWAVRHNLGGIENMSLIPGTVGASPVQNIGAYGVELKDVFHSLRAIDLQTARIRAFTRKECAFGYRDSIFKREARGKFCIIEVIVRLQKAPHRINISYGDIQKTLADMGASQPPSIDEISRAVIAIRSSKLPDPAKIGNCGSFFKNPEIPVAQLEKLLQNYPQAPHYPLPDHKAKVPAGWLIEQCGWKGKRVGNVGCYEKQALVLVNHGGATGQEAGALAHAIIESVETRFGIRLEPEVNIW